MHPPSASAGPTLLSPLPAGSAWLAMKTSGELLANSPLLPQLHLTLTFTIQTPRALYTVLDLSTLYSVFLVQTQCLPRPVFHSLKRMNTAFSFSLIYSITSISPSGSGPFPPHRVSRINPISLLIWSLHQIPFFQACELLQICRPLGLSQLSTWLKVLTILPHVKKRTWELRCCSGLNSGQQGRTNWWSRSDGNLGRKGPCHVRGGYCEWKKHWI